MKAELSAASSLKGCIKRVLERTVSQVLFVQALLNDYHDRAASVGVTAIDWSEQGATMPTLVGRMARYRLAPRLPVVAALNAHALHTKPHDARQ